MYTRFVDLVNRGVLTPVGEIWRYRSDHFHYYYNNYVYFMRRCLCGERLVMEASVVTQRQAVMMDCLEQRDGIDV